jgi:hypothetical protein
MPTYDLLIRLLQRSRFRKRSSLTPKRISRISIVISKSEVTRRNPTTNKTMLR